MAPISRPVQVKLDALSVYFRRNLGGSLLTDVAERSGIERSAISKLETGKVMNPTISTLQRYAEALNQRITWNLRPAEAAAS